MVTLSHGGYPLACSAEVVDTDDDGDESWTVETRCWCHGTLNAYTVENLSEEQADALARDFNSQPHVVSYN